MTSIAPAPVIVVGGGIGGLAAALSLASCGRRVHVLERSSEFGELGAGIQLAPNALHVLGALGVLESVLAEAVKPVRATMRNARDGDVLAEMDFGPDFQDTFGAPYIVTHRGDLLTALLAGCRASDLISLETARHVIALGQRGDTVLVTCEDGSRYSAELVIGADGLRSVCREHVLDDGPPVCTGDVAYRGAIPVARAPYVSGEPTIDWWVGPNVHLIHYPVRGGTLINQVGVFTSDAYRDGVDPGSPDWGTPEELDERFSDLDERVRSSVALLDRDRRWALFDRPPAPTWIAGRVVLIGDAAHPMLQYLAQGAGQALEDAFTIGSCLADSSVDVAAALSRYENLRRPQAGFAQAWSRRMGEIVHGDGIVAILRDALLRQLDPKDFRYVDRLYRGSRGHSSPAARRDARSQLDTTAAAERGWGRVS